MKNETYGQIGGGIGTIVGSYYGGSAGGAIGGKTGTKEGDKWGTFINDADSEQKTDMIVNEISMMFNPMGKIQEMMGGGGGVQQKQEPITTLSEDKKMTGSLGKKPTYGGSPYMTQMPDSSSYGGSPYMTNIPDSYIDKNSQDYSYGNPDLDAYMADWSNRRR